MLRFASCNLASVLQRRLDEGAKEGIQDGVFNDGETLEGRRCQQGENGATGVLLQRLGMDHAFELPSKTRLLY